MTRQVNDFEPFDSRQDEARNRHFPSRTWQGADDPRRHLNAIEQQENKPLGRSDASIISKSESAKGYVLLADRNAAIARATFSEGIAEFLLENDYNFE
jgi:hypothetical protein